MVWLRLSAGTIDRCIREAGLACEPIVEGLLTDLRQSGLINADETPWPQRGHLRWLWVALSSTTAIYKIASRRAEEIRDLIGERSSAGWSQTVMWPIATIRAGSAVWRI